MPIFNTIFNSLFFSIFILLVDNSYLPKLLHVIEIIFEQICRVELTNVLLQMIIKGFC